MPFGAEITAEGTRFALWAPGAEDVSLNLDGSQHAMGNREGGWRELTVPRVGAGQRYAYKLASGLVVPDPASRFQPDDVHAPSLVVDPKTYGWSDGAWAGRPWEEAVIYEVHVGTVTRVGTFAAFAAKLGEVAELGITAVELMPVADFAGRRNWGYDGVLPYAPDAAYGRPDDLKQLIDRAHALGLMIFIDVVYNHFGPSGNYLHAYANSFFTDRHPTPWGAGINFDGPDSRTVRDFFIHNALYWLEEFHADGLRFDAVHAIEDDSPTHILAEIADTVHDAFPAREVHLVLENDANEARWLARDAKAKPRFYTAQWNDDLHHAWHVLLTGENEAYYGDYAEDAAARLGRSLCEGFAYQGEASRHRGGKPRGEPSAHLPPTAFVGFLQNHDQIGNRAFGERLSHVVSLQRLALARALLLLCPQIPLLFMGEEWAASTPFLFFVDFAQDEALAEAVRSGRRHEFSRFSAFAAAEMAERIPDPLLESTASRSVLDWNERAREPHAQIVAETKGLLRLRRQHIQPLTKTPYRSGQFYVTGDRALEVRWRFEDGTLHLVVNLGDAEIANEIDPLQEIIWTSRNAVVAGRNITLPSWGGMMSRSRP
jgi:maltooligosyltrehalose trehalohydrolase